MKIDLKKYMTERDRVRELKNAPGPVLTLSRQYGCEANKIALKLLARLSDISVGWQYINKEIINESAKILNLAPDRLAQRVLSHGQSMVSDVFSSFSNQYTITDKKIVEKVREIIETYAKKGKVIIVGRGGSAIIRNRPLALHVRLVASLAYRSQVISAKQKLTDEEARLLIRQVDTDRELWSEHLSHQAYDPYLFDLSLNRQTLTENEIVDIILRMMKSRKMI